MEADAVGVGTTADRRNDAEALTELIEGAPGQVVVVLGPRVSGKSKFIEAKLWPALAVTQRTQIIDCGLQPVRDSFDLLAEAGVVIMDSFDRVLKSTDASTKADVEALLTRPRRATLVLVAATHCLGDFFDLRKLEPAILDHLFELTQLRLGSELARLGAASQPPVEYHAATLDALENDLAQFDVPAVTFRLVELVDRGYRAGFYRPERGLRGLLDAHLDAVLGALDSQPGFGDGASHVARAVLKEVVLTGPQRAMPSLAGLAEQLDVAPGVPEACLEWLLKSSGVVRFCEADGWQFDPPQLREIVKDWIEEDHDLCGKAERLLADGMEGRQKVGTLLPRDRFQDVNAQQRLLRVTSEQASFLALCALRFYPGHDPGPVNYWFRRIGDSALEVQTLTEALADPIPAARQRAANMLGGYDEPRVHGHLCRLALEDADAKVRRQAWESLARFANKEPIYHVLAAAAAGGPSHACIRAIQALRIFPDERCAGFLESVISNPTDTQVREAAIDALANTNCEAGVAALVRIALRDQDEADRERAREALSGLTTEHLLEFGVSETERDYYAGLPKPSEGGWWARLGHWPPALLILFTNFWIHGLALFFLKRWRWGAGFLAVEVFAVLGMFEVLDARAWLVVPLWLLNGLAATLAASLESRRKPAAPGTFARTLSNVLLAGVMLSSGLLLHGIGHWITGRRRKAIRFFGIELLAILALVSTFALEHLFAAGSVRSGLDRFSAALLFLYRYGGLVLSWLAAVASLIEGERWGRRGPWRSPAHCGVLRSLLASPVSSGMLLRRLQSPGARESRHARQWFAHFGDSIPGSDLMRVLRQNQSQTPKEMLDCLARYKGHKGYERVVIELGEMFDDGGPQDRTLAVRLLAKYPTEGSIQALSTRRSALVGVERLHFWRAACVRPFRGWPPLVKVAAVGLALLALLLIADGLRTLRNPGWPQIKELKELSGSSNPSKISDLSVTAEFLAVRYPRRSAEELASLFAQCDAAHASGLGRSLAKVAGSYNRSAEEEFQKRDRHYWWQDPQGAWEARQFRQELEEARAARSLAVAALIKGLGDEKKRMVSQDSLRHASETGGSPELVAGLDDQLSKLDKPEKVAELDNQRFAGSIAAMLSYTIGNVPRSRDVIGRRAEILSGALQSSPEIEVKNQIMRALAASRDPRAVDALKSFVLFDGLPLQTVRREGAANDPARARDVVSLSTVQRDARGAAVELLRAMNTREAAKAIEDLQTQAKRLPPELSAKLQPTGREAATQLNADAQRLQTGGNLAEALKKAEGAVKADPQLPDAHGTLGSILYELNRKGEAYRQFQEAARLWPGYSWAYYMQALILRDQGRFRAAEAPMREALRTDPSFPWTYRLLREIYVAQSRDKEAVAELSHLQQLYPEVAEIYAQLAYIYHERIAPKDPSAYEQAYQSNRKLLEIQKRSNPAEADATEANLLECSLTTGRYSEVIERAPALAARFSNHDWQMAMYLLTLTAQVLNQDDRQASDTLIQVETLYARAFRGRKSAPDWVYNGTVHYLERRVPPSPQQAALVNLIRAINTTPASVAPGLFEAVRASLETMSKRG